MLSRASAANIGLAHLENAILDAISDDVSVHPWWHMAEGDLAIYPGIRVDDGRPGTVIVRTILKVLQKEGRVEWNGHRWVLTAKGRRGRRSQ